MKIKAHVSDTKYIVQCRRYLQRRRVYQLTVFVLNVFLHKATKLRSEAANLQETGLNETDSRVVIVKKSRNVLVMIDL